MIQPLIVREVTGPDAAQTEYQIVAGERRWRAAQIAQLHDVPVVVRSLSDLEVLEVAIIENVQRADLNPIEEAAGYRQLIDRFGHTQDQLARGLGKSRSHIANQMRLLSLPPEVQALVTDGDLSAGHARALINAGDPGALARRVVKQGLSVRETERLVRSLAHPKKPGRAPAAPAEKDADTRMVEQELTAALGLKVQIEPAADRQSGRMVLTYRSLEQLDDLMRLLSS